MPNLRAILQILIILIILVVIFLWRKSQPEEVDQSFGTSLATSAPNRIETYPNGSSVGGESGGGVKSSAAQRVITSVGDQVILKVYADQTFQLFLPETSKNIFVLIGKELFTSVDLPTGISLPFGVKIKVRNGAGEIFTAERGYGLRLWHGPGDDLWYRPGSNQIEMPIFSSRLTKTGERIDIPRSADAIHAISNEAGSRISPRGYIEDLIYGLSPRLRQQSGLEFKLAIIPTSLPNARDSEADYLSLDDFPRYETEWLDGKLLFADE